jgi:hypothetical protein
MDDSLIDTAAATIRMGPVGSRYHELHVPVAAVAFESPP